MEGPSEKKKGEEQPMEGLEEKTDTAGAVHEASSNEDCSSKDDSGVVHMFVRNHQFTTEEDKAKHNADFRLWVECEWYECKGDRCFFCKGSMCRAKRPPRKEADTGWVAARNPYKDRLANDLIDYAQKNPEVAGPMLADLVDAHKQKKIKLTERVSKKLGWIKDEHQEVLKHKAAEEAKKLAEVSK